MRWCEALASLLARIVVFVIGLVVGGGGLYILLRRVGIDISYPEVLAVLAMLVLGLGLMISSLTTRLEE